MMHNGRNMKSITAGDLHANGCPDDMDDTWPQAMSSEKERQEGMDLKAKKHCCEEASPMSHNFYIPCNKPATTVVHCDKDRRDYRMCEMCAVHNTRNRGMTMVGPYDRKSAKPHE